ncbi:hypothetical protein LQD23_16240 [Chromobacterium violaceum]|uniref:hypothetical protein n=1 Tax=Chromobacterium violaceum TaxID=536 RepID=UPI001E4CF1E0|nr:hypothetical protein [Chromobacterium violaceum]MCD0493831.1 hypothetical protein [Chromobacterium violaceum]
MDIDDCVRRARLVAGDAIHAARQARRCGIWCMARYACKRRVPVRALLLAMRLEGVI